MTRPWERPLPAGEALAGLELPVPEPPPPPRLNRALVVFDDDELAAVRAVAEQRGEPLAVSIRVLAVAVARHLVERGRWPSAPPEAERVRRRSTARESKSLVVLSDDEWQAVSEAALNRWAEPVSSTIRALAVAGARYVLAGRKPRGRK